MPVEEHVADRVPSWVPDWGFDVRRETVAAAGGKARIIRIAPRLLQLTWDKGTIVGATDAQDVLNRSATLVGNVPYAVMVNLHDISGISVAARDAFRTDERITACAMIGSSPMDQVLAAFSSRAIHPTRFLSSELKAVHWLASHLSAHQTRITCP
ncbi:DUF7793 family protein [Arthrobacter sp. MDT3-44]